MGSLKLYKRYLLVALSMTLVLQTVLMAFSTTVYAASSSNDMRTTLIQLGAGTLNSSSDTTKLTASDLQILGVYLSNFYVPWSTQVSSASSKTDDDDAMKKNMVNALTTTLSYDEATADSVVGAVFSMMQTSATKLSLCIVNGNSNGSNIDNDNATYYDLLRLASDVGNQDPNNVDNASFAPLSYAGKSYYMYWGDKDAPHIVFSGVAGATNFSPSGYALNSCLQECDLKNGYGDGLLALSKDSSSGAISNDDAKAWLASFNGNPEKLLSTTLYGWSMYVDCFGDLIVDCHTGRQYILVPGCMNPYTWIDGSPQLSADAVSKTENKDRQAGTSVPVNNLYSMLNSSSIYPPTEKDGTVVNYYTLQNKTASLISDSFNTNDDGSLLMTQYRGSDSTSFDSDSTFFVGLFKDGSAGSLLKDIVKAYENGTGLYSKPSLASRIKFPDMYNLAVMYQHNWSASVTPFYYPRALTDNESVAKQKTGLMNGNSNYTGPIIDDYIMFDSYNLFTSLAKAGNTTAKSMPLNPSGIFADKKGTSFQIPSSGFKNSLSAEGGFNLLSSNNITKKYLAGIYSSYVFAFYENSTSIDKHVTYSFNKSGLPTFDVSDITFGSTASSEELQLKELRSLSYYFLHPTAGVSLVNTWFKNKVGGVLLSTHEDIVGDTDTEASTGTTKYTGFSGYVTIPELTDMAWSDFLITSYASFIPMLILFIFIILLGYMIIGAMSFQKVILGTLIFALCAYLPPIFIDATVSASNSISNSIYSQKFTYWALVQHQEYASQLASSIESNDYGAYLTTLFNQQASDNSTDSSHIGVVTLKWMSPKKSSTTAAINQEFTTSGVPSYMLPTGVVSQISGETYLSGNNNLYLYRSYTDIAVNSRYVWDSLGSKNKTRTPISIASSLAKNYQNLANYTSTTKEGGLLTGYSLGFNYASATTDFSSTMTDEEKNKRYVYLYRNTIVNDAVTKIDNTSMNNLATNDFIGIQKSDFDLTLSNIRDGVGTDQTKQDQLGLYVFGMYSESPYYFFNWNLYDQTSQISDGYNVSNFVSSEISLFLGEEKSYFYNDSTNPAIKDTSAYGEMRDYMDMGTLFTVVIPYLKSVNDAVRKWDDIYGFTLYDNIDIYDSSGNIKPCPDNATEEYKYKYWYNRNVAQLANMYTPWVDTMYDCNYAKAEKISVAGEKYTVNDPLDPSSYPGEDAGRPMIFSKSEMVYYGLNETQLTTVERKILQVAEGSYKNLLQLVNYYNFSDEVIATAAGVTETFEFNKVFSQTSFIGTSYVLYPQSFELKNFSYDAFLRLILSNTTNENLQSTDGLGIYQTVLNNSSIFTAVFMLILDGIAVWLIPLLREIFLVLISIMSILMILASAIKIEMNVLKTVMKSLVAPLLKFLIISTGLAFMVSLFMSNGYEGVTGATNVSISLGDPVMVILCMIFINIIALVLYWLVCWKTFKNCRKYGTAVGSSILGMGGGAIAKAVGFATGGAVAATVGGSVMSASARGAANGVRSLSHGVNTLGSGGASAFANSRLTQQGRDTRTLKREQYAIDRAQKSTRRFDSMSDESKARSQKAKELRDKGKLVLDPRNLSASRTSRLADNHTEKSEKASKMAKSAKRRQELINLINQKGK